MEQNKQLSLQFANISGKKVTADFTGGEATRDVGVMVMREVADKIGIIEQLAKTLHIMHTLREKALAGTALAKAQFDTIRLKLLKIGAEVRELKTRLHFILPASCPVKDIFVTMTRNIALLL